MFASESTMVEAFVLNEDGSIGVVRQHGRDGRKSEEEGKQEDWDGVLSLLLLLVEQQKLFVWVCIVWQLVVGMKDGRVGKQNEEEGKDVDCGSNVLTITFESKVSYASMLSLMVWQGFCG